MFLVILLVAPLMVIAQGIKKDALPLRERLSINTGWKFMRYTEGADKLIYDIRPEVTDRNDNKVADSKPTEAVIINSSEQVLKNWILPVANDFIKDPAKHYKRPEGNPGNDFSFVQNNFNDAAWEKVNLPHDWAIKGPFYKEANATVGGGMGRLPVQGVGLVQKKNKHYRCRCRQKYLSRYRWRHVIRNGLA